MEEESWSFANTDSQNQMKRNIRTNERKMRRKKMYGAKEEILKWNMKYSL